MGETRSHRGALPGWFRFGPRWAHLGDNPEESDVLYKYPRQVWAACFQECGPLVGHGSGKTVMTIMRTVLAGVYGLFATCWALFPALSFFFFFLINFIFLE